MKDILFAFLAVLITYTIGGIPFALLIGRWRGVDIRQHGSGNVGATNVARVCGLRWGVLCFFCDALKGAIPVLTARSLPVLKQNPHHQWIVLLVMFAAVAGHVWTPYLHFRGGKGIATSAGAVAAIAPVPLLFALLVWGAVFQLSSYVSLASICAAATLPVTAWVFYFIDGERVSMAVPAVLTVLGALAILRHHGNIRRLIQGTESKMKRKKEKNEDSGSK